MTNTEKIVHILPVFCKQIQYSFQSIASRGGGERYASELALHISKYADTTLVCFGEIDYDFTYQNLKIQIIKCKPFLKIFNGDADYICFRLFAVIKRFDIIHVHGYFNDTAIFAVFAAKIFKRKIFITDHGWRGLTVSRYFPAKYFCNKILVQTNYDKIRLGLEDDKCEIIYGGVDLAKYTYCGNKKRKVIFIGRLMPHKGVNYLIDALDNQTECVIAGHKHNNTYFDLLNRLASGKNIKFYLSASDDEIIANLKDSSILVLPSVDVDAYGRKHRNSELFGLVIAEAFACGTPVIVSDSSALPYVVDDNVNGFVVPQNDASAISEKINYLLNSPEKVIAMGKRGREKAEAIFNWDSVAKKCLINYNK